MALLRTAFRMAECEIPGFTAIGSETSLLGLLTSSTELQRDVHGSLFNPNSLAQPKIRLLAPRTKTFSPEVSDQLPESLRARCIPLKGTDRVCALEWPDQQQQQQLPEPKLLVDFRIDERDAFLSITRGQAPESLILVAFSDVGKRRKLTITGIMSTVVDHLLKPFEISDMDEELATSLPSRRGELPAALQSSVADFWQNCMRCHVVATVCAPDDATRPLAFESIVALEPTTAGRKLTLEGTVHPSSMSCACKLHNLSSVQDRFPSESFDGSKRVTLLLSMCGRKRSRLGALFGECPVHGRNTPDVDMFPGICCHGTVAQLGCYHGISGNPKEKRRFKCGLFVHDMNLKRLDLLHAQALLATASAVASNLAPFVGEGGSTVEVRKICTKAERKIDRVIDEIDRKRAISSTNPTDPTSSTNLLNLDMAAVDALRAGKYRRHVCCDGSEVLACDGPDGSCTKCTKAEFVHGLGPPLELAQTHLHLFAPPLFKRRR